MCIRSGCLQFYFVKLNYEFRESFTIYSFYVHHLSPVSDVRWWPVMTTKTNASIMKAPLRATFIRGMALKINKIEQYSNNNN